MSYEPQKPKLAVIYKYGLIKLVKEFDDICKATEFAHWSNGKVVFMAEKEKTATVK